MLREIPVADIHRFEEELFEYLTAVKSDLLASIRETGELTPETTEQLKESILSVKEKFIK
jgi:F0F1-type ATP synthase alpha subunit